MHKFYYLLSAFLILSCGTKPEPLQPLAEEMSTNRLQDSLAFELCKMFGGDQIIREPFISGGKVNWDYIHQLDTLSFNKAISFIKNNGYSTASLVGNENYQHECVSASLNAILLHSPHLIVNNRQHFELLLNEADKGNLDREIFAAILDKGYLMQKKYKYVIYGTKAFGMPCRDIKDRTNTARAEIGLPPLADSLFVDCSAK